MAYVSEAVCSSLVPKLIGSYEAELNETLAILFKKDFKRIVDIGCAEGYYAVGLAMKLPEAQVYAFDIDAKARELCRQLALANNVGDRLIIESECNHERLRELTTERTLIVSDCEGCELELLQPDLVPGFRNCDLVVELHEMVTAGITETILNRFLDSHEITLIDSETRDASQYPAIKHYPAAVRATAVAEFRDTRMQWAHMSAKAT
jgi:ribosomal protein L11 methylase PrmA